MIMLDAERRGFSLLEVLVAMGVMYIVCAYLLGLFASGYRCQAGNREYTATLFLARSKMERLCCMPVECLASVKSGYCEAPYGKYSWKATVSKFDECLNLLTVEVKSPRGSRSTLQCLRRNHAFQGVDCDEFSDQVAWSAPNSKALSLWQSSAAPTRWQVALNTSVAKLATLGGISGVPGLGVVWATATDKGQIGYYVFDSRNRLSKSRSLTATAPTNGNTPIFTGISADCWANNLYCADIANAAIWIAQDSNGKLRWSANSPLRPQKMPLSDPMGLALDESASVLWIAEAGAHALRPLFLSTAVTPTGTGVEKISGLGWWGARLSPSSGSGEMNGVAVNPWSSAVYAVDSSHLHRLIYSCSAAGKLTAQWYSCALPEELQQQFPSGMCCDAYNDVLFINTKRGQLWRVTLASQVSFSAVR